MRNLDEADESCMQPRCTSRVWLASLVCFPRIACNPGELRGQAVSALCATLRQAAAAALWSAVLQNSATPALAKSAAQCPHILCVGIQRVRVETSGSAVNCIHCEHGMLGTSRWGNVIWDCPPNPVMVRSHCNPVEQGCRRTCNITPLRCAARTAY